MTNNYLIWFPITNTISVTYTQLLLTYLVPKYIPVVYEQRCIVLILPLSNDRGYIKFLETYHFDFDINKKFVNQTHVSLHFVHYNYNRSCIV